MTDKEMEGQLTALAKRKRRSRGSGRIAIDTRFAQDPTALEIRELKKMLNVTLEEISEATGRVPSTVSRASLGRASDRTRKEILGVLREMAASLER